MPHIPTKPDGFIYLMELRRTGLPDDHDWDKIYQYKVGFSQTREGAEKRRDAALQMGQHSARILKCWPALRQWETQARWVLSMASTCDVPQALIALPYVEMKRYKGHETFETIRGPGEMKQRGDEFFETIYFWYDVDEGHPATKRFYGDWKAEE